MATERQIFVWTDGSIRRAPGCVHNRAGHSGAAWVMRMEAGDTRQTSVPSTWEGKEYLLGFEDNNVEVELMAIRYALEYLAERLWRTNGFFGDVVVIHCDCQKALDAISAAAIHDPVYGAEVETILATMRRIESGALARPVIFRWTPRMSCEGIVMADTMATRASHASSVQQRKLTRNVGDPDQYPRFR